MILIFVMQIEFKAKKPTTKRSRLFQYNLTIDTSLKTRIVIVL